MYLDLYSLLTRCPPTLAPLLTSQDHLRLETFFRFLAEQWEFVTFLGFLTVNSLAMQVGERKVGDGEGNSYG